MGARRGPKVPAADASVYAGSPVFYDNAHAVICVGKNAAGRPIINAHNNDRWHMPWDYYTGAESITTVQLTRKDPLLTEPEPDPDPEPPLRGDVDGNGRVEAADARLLFTLLSEGAAAPDSADADGNGRADARDAVLIFRLAAGKNQ